MSFDLTGNISIDGAGYVGINLPGAPANYATANITPDGEFIGSLSFFDGSAVYFTNQTLFWTQDGSSYPNPVELPFQVTLSAPDLSQQHSVITAGQDGQVIRANVETQTYDYVTIPNANDLVSIVSTGNYIVATDTSGNTYVSSTNGNSWSPSTNLPTPVNPQATVLPADWSQTPQANGAPQAIVNNGGNVVFTPSTPNTPPIVFNPSSGVFTTFSTPTAIRLRTTVYNPSDGRLYVAGDSGTIFSTNDGTSWAEEPVATPLANYTNSTYNAGQVTFTAGPDANEKTTVARKVGNAWSRLYTGSDTQFVTALPVNLTTTQGYNEAGVGRVAVAEDLRPQIWINHVGYAIRNTPRRYFNNVSPASASATIAGALGLGWTTLNWEDLNSASVDELSDIAESLNNVGGTGRYLAYNFPGNTTANPMGWVGFSGATVLNQAAMYHLGYSNSKAGYTVTSSLQNHWFDRGAVANTSLPFMAKKAVAYENYCRGGANTYDSTQQGYDYDVAGYRYHTYSPSPSIDHSIYAVYTRPNNTDNFLTVEILLVGAGGRGGSGPRYSFTPSGYGGGGGGGGQIVYTDTIVSKGYTGLLFEVGYGGGNTVMYFNYDYYNRTYDRAIYAVSGGDGGALYDGSSIPTGQSGYTGGGGAASYYVANSYLGGSGTYGSGGAGAGTFGGGGGGWGGSGQNASNVAGGRGGPGVYSTFLQRDGTPYYLSPGGDGYGVTVRSPVGWGGGGRGSNESTGFPAGIVVIRYPIGRPNY
jgi:hypothetical protein